MLTIDKTLCTLSPEDIMESVEIFYGTYYDVFQKKFSGTGRAADNTVFLGGGSGFVSKTIVYALYGEQEAIHITKDIFEKTNVPREHKHGMDPRLGVSPHILKCTHYRGKEYMTVSYTHLKEFYLNILGFKLEYEREADRFIFLSFEETQLMFEEMHENGWNVAEMSYPFGRGINFSIEVEDVDMIYHKLILNEYPLYRSMILNKYEVNGEYITQKEFLVQDPDGYLLRFTN